MERRQFLSSLGVGVIASVTPSVLLGNIKYHSEPKELCEDLLIQYQNHGMVCHNFTLDDIESVRNAIYNLRLYFPNDTCSQNFSCRCLNPIILTYKERETKISNRLFIEYRADIVRKAVELLLND